MAVQGSDLTLGSVDFIACEKTAKKHKKQANANEEKTECGEETQADQ